MSAATHKVDVLAELRRMAQQAAGCRGAAYGAGTDEQRDGNAIAAVAELFEADIAYDNVRSGIEVTAHEMQETADRRRAALARVRGLA